MTSSEAEVPTHSTWESQPEAGTSGSCREADSAHSWTSARDTGIELADADADAEEARENVLDMRAGMTRYFSEGQKRKVVGKSRICCCSIGTPVLRLLSFIPGLMDGRGHHFLRRVRQHSLRAVRWSRDHIVVEGTRQRIRHLTLADS